MGRRGSSNDRAGILQTYLFSAQEEVRDALQIHEVYRTIQQGQI